MFLNVFNYLIEKNQRVFVYEEGNWSLKGRYQIAVRNNDTVTWSKDSAGEHSLTIALVELSIAIHIRHNLLTVHIIFRIMKLC